MNLIKLLVAIVPLAIIPTLSNASSRMNLHCKDGVAPEACLVQVGNALANLGCDIDSRSFDCDYALLPDPNSTIPDATIQANSAICTVVSSNCQQPQQVLFQGDTCRPGEKMVKIPKKTGIDNGYWYGIFGAYSRNICIAE